MKKSAENLKIRRMRHSDIPAIVRIISREIGAVDGKKAKKDMTTQERRFYADGEMFVAESGGKVIGMAGYWRMEYHPRNVCWMDWFAVDRHYQGKGVALRFFRT